MTILIDVAGRVDVRSRWNAGGHRRDQDRGLAASVRGVRNPGGTRGGRQALLPDADPTHLPNLAGRLKDGEQVKDAFAKGPSGTVAPPTNLNTASLGALERRRPALLDFHDSP